MQGGHEPASGPSCPLAAGSAVPLLGVTVELVRCSSGLVLSPAAGTTAEGRQPSLQRLGRWAGKRGP